MYAVQSKAHIISPRRCSGSVPKKHSESISEDTEVDVDVDVRCLVASTEVHDDFNSLLRSHDRTALNQDVRRGGPPVVEPFFHRLAWGCPPSGRCLLISSATFWWEIQRPLR
jgi:hypothetical protein